MTPFPSSRESCKFHFISTGPHDLFSTGKLGGVGFCFGVSVVRFFETTSWVNYERLWCIDVVMLGGLQVVLQSRVGNGLSFDPSHRC